MAYLSALALSASLLSGIMIHCLHFIRGEHHLQAPVILCGYGAALSVLLIFSPVTHGIPPSGSEIIIFASHVIGLLASMSIYRLCFHPLREFPGPIDMRLSKLAHVKRLLASRCKNYEVLEGLHNVYGDYVRTGPNELTIFHPEVLTEATRPGNELNHSDWYDLLLPSEPIATSRNRADHDARRRVFDRAFSKTGLKNQENFLGGHVENLEQEIATLEGRPVEVGELFLRLSFDIMGVFGFGQSFNTVQSSRWRHAIDMLKDFMFLQGPLAPVPWVGRIGIHISLLSSSWWNFKRWCQGMYHERLQNDVKGDIFDHLIHGSDLGLARDKLEGDAIAVVVAGSETTASVLTLIFYHIALDTSLQDRLRSEIVSIGVIWNSDDLDVLPVLNAIIQETLRLYPPLATSGLRQVGPSGLRVAGVFIPPNVTIAMPMYNFGRLESCYTRAKEFLPQRWLDQPHMVKNRSVYQPFSKGRYACPGRGLALREIRLLVSVLILRYNITLAADEDGLDILSNMRDNYVLSPGKLRLSFKARDP